MLASPGTNLGRFVPFWVPPGAGIVEALGCNLREVMVNFRDARETARLHSSNRSRGQATKRLPNNVAVVCHSAQDATHELQWLLVKMRGRQAAGVINPRGSPFHRAFYPLHSMQWRQRPDISNPVHMPPLVPQRVPVLAGHRGLPVEGIIGPARFGAVLVSVCSQALDHLTRRPVPQPVSREVFARRGVSHPACFVGSGQGEPRTLPLIAQPLLHGHEPVDALDFEAALIEGTYLGRDRETADRLPVDIARNVSDAFVPGDDLHVIPSALNEQRVDRGPANFSVPEPEGGGRCRRPAPRLHVRPVPIKQATDTGRVPVEPADAIRAVTDNDGRRRPALVGG